MSWKTYILRRIFCSTTYQILVTTILLVLRYTGQKEMWNRKETCCFYICYKNLVCFKRWKFVSKAVFYFKILQIIILRVKTVFFFNVSCFLCFISLKLYTSIQSRVTKKSRIYCFTWLAGKLRFTLDFLCFWRTATCNFKERTTSSACATKILTSILSPYFYEPSNYETQK